MREYRINWHDGREARSNIYAAATREDALRKLDESRRAVAPNERYRVASVSTRCPHVTTLVDRNGEPEPRRCHQFTSDPSGCCARHREQVTA